MYCCIWDSNFSLWDISRNAKEGFKKGTWHTIFDTRFHGWVKSWFLSVSFGRAIVRSVAPLSAIKALAKSTQWKSDHGIDGSDIENLSRFHCNAKRFEVGRSHTADRDGSRSNLAACHSAIHIETNIHRDLESSFSSRSARSEHIEWVLVVKPFKTRNREKNFWKWRFIPRSIAMSCEIAWVRTANARGPVQSSIEHRAWHHHPQWVLGLPEYGLWFVWLPRDGKVLKGMTHNSIEQIHTGDCLESARVSFD
jgi:hypothetical protein